MTDAIFKPGDVVVASTKYRNDLPDGRAFVVLVAYERDTTSPDPKRWRQGVVLFPLSGPVTQGMARQKTLNDAGKAYRQSYEIEHATGDLNLRQFSGSSARSLQQRFLEIQQDAQKTADESGAALTPRAVFQGTIPVLDEPREPRSRTLTGTALIAQELREELKKAGIKPRDVSVRTDNYSMGSSIHVEILSLDVPYKTVHDLANKRAHVRHCEVTGEILSGGNRYVSVEVSSDALKAATVEARKTMSYLGCTIEPVYTVTGSSPVGFYCPALNTRTAEIWGGDLEPAIRAVVAMIYEARSHRAAFDARCEREEHEAKNPSSALRREIERLRKENEALKAKAQGRAA